MRDRKNMFINVVGSYSKFWSVDTSVNVSVVELSVTNFPNFMGRRFLRVVYSFFEIPENRSFKNRVTDDDMGDEHFKVEMVQVVYDLGCQEFYLEEI